MDPNMEADEYLQPIEGALEQLSGAQSMTVRTTKTSKKATLLNTTHSDLEPPAPLPDADLQAHTAWLQSRRKRVKSPSHRTPHISWYHNTADQIEHQMNSDGHELWGFAIYRTTYDNDTEWTEAMRRLRHNYEEQFHWVNGDDILEKLRFTVMDDKAIFDGASTDDVRRHFQKWSIANYKIEQPQPEASQHQFKRLGRSPRYHFAIQIDKESLRSILGHAPAPPTRDLECDAWVKVIDKSWYLGRSEYEDDPCEAIDGVSEHDVGWMKVSIFSVMTGWYELSERINHWSLAYVRPPELAR